MAYGSVSDVKQLADISGTSDDNLIQKLLESVSEDIDNRLKNLFGTHFLSAIGRASDMCERHSHREKCLTTLLLRPLVSKMRIVWLS